MSLRDHIRRLEAKAEAKNASGPQTYLLAYREQMARLREKVAGFSGDLLA